ncbi:MAG: hypothetical protein FD180_5188, partial [Planctomycetota bacterium]
MRPREAAEGPGSRVAVGTEVRDSPRARGRASLRAGQKVSWAGRGVAAGIPAAREAERRRADRGTGTPERLRLQGTLERLPEEDTQA